MTQEIPTLLIDVTEEVLNEETGQVETISYQVAEPAEPIDYRAAKSVRSEGGVYYVEY